MKNTNDEVDFGKVRSIIQTWLKLGSHSLRSLAKASDLNPATISRFLRGGGIKSRSVLNVYHAIYADLSFSDRYEYLRSAGLLREIIEINSSFNSSTVNSRVSDHGNEPDWSMLRTLIQERLAYKHYTPSRLSFEAGIEPAYLSKFLPNKQKTLEAKSVLRICSILYENNDAISRREFLKAAGLLFVIEISQSLLPFQLQGILSISVSSLELGNQWIIFGQEIARHSWESALPAFKSAESLLGEEPSEALNAASSLVAMLVNLGDYNAAQMEIDRIFRVYSLANDPEIAATLYIQKGWILFYQGNYRDAVQYMSNGLKLAEQIGDNKAKGSALHFLGRIFVNWGQERKDVQLLKQGDQYFTDSLRVRSKWGMASDQAFDFLRKSQLYRIQSRGVAAWGAREKAKQLFGQNQMGGLHIALEEARIELANGELRRPRYLANMALEKWAHHKYAKGIADSLRILGNSELTRGKHDQALGIYIASLCIYPFDDHLENRDTINTILHISKDIMDGRSTYTKQLQRISSAAKNRQGYFSYLNHIVPDRSSDIIRIINKIGTFNGKLWVRHL